jgi:hypothetical protein
VQEAAKAGVKVVSSIAIAAANAAIPVLEMKKMFNSLF